MKPRLQLQHTFSSSCSFVFPIHKTDIHGTGCRNDHVMRHSNPAVEVSLIIREMLSPGHTLHFFNSGLASVLPFVQIDKIMSSIGAGIRSGLDFKEENSGEAQMIFL